MQVHSTAVAAERCPRLICEDVRKRLRCTENAGGKAAAGIRLRSRGTPVQYREFQLAESADSQLAADVIGVQDPIGAVTDAALGEKSRHGNNGDDDKAKQHRD